MQAFTRIQINVHEKVAEIALNRPDKANALDERMWVELAEAMHQADQASDVRAILLTGEGSNFCAGIDLAFLSAVYQKIKNQSAGKQQELLREIIKGLQNSISSCEQCRKPVIAAIHGACYGGGIAIITACDLRYSTEDARFAVKEIDLGIVADVGTLQRLPRIIGEGRAREWIYTGEVFTAQQALEAGMVTKVLPDRESLLDFARLRARLIAQKSPLTVRGTKHMLNYSRDHFVQDGLDYVATWNAAMLLSADVEEALSALMMKRHPVFND